MGKRKSNLPPLEDISSRKRRVKKMLGILKKNYPIGKRTALDYVNPIEMVVATILSAQCTDKQVNMVTPALFKKYHTIKDFANADVIELETLIKPTGFFHNKTKNIIASAKGILEKFGGEVPRSIEDLTQLTGIGRKTANVIKYAVWGDNDGIAVDTHVGRLSRRLELSYNMDAGKVEQDLLEVTPADARGEFSWMIIQHGRAICDARKPLCSQCPMANLCPSAGHADNIK